MDSRIRVTICKTGNRRLLNEVFESKPIKRRSKILFQQSKRSLDFKKSTHNLYEMASQTITNNNFTTAPTSPNPYISKKLNNMDQAQVMKREREDWMRLYHKTLKGVETMIDVQRIAKDIKKLAEETNTILTEIEGTVLVTSINNRVINATNIMQISEDLRQLVQSDMDDRAFQVQRMLADELDRYKGKGNEYMDDNIKKIQELYMEEEKKDDKGTIENKEVILICPYVVSSTTTSSSRTSFITDEVENLTKYMKFVKTLSQTRIFRLPPYYQSLKSRGEQDPTFWKEVATAFLDKKRNTDMSRNRYQIPMYQGGPPHEPYFIAVNNRGQVIIGPSKKIVATYVVGELEVLV